MIFTLHRYIFSGLLRVFVLATIALTLMLSVGSILRPIQEHGMGPGQVVHLLGYFLPITLTFVLPMSALFASAIVYGRFASDNELDACRASGISFMTLVYPGLCLAIVVTITTLILSFHVVPAFVHRAEKALKANAKQMLFRNIQRKGYYNLPGKRFRIYADRAIPQDNILIGVTIVESKDMDISKLITAKTAKILIDTQKRFNEITVVAQDAYQIDDDGQAYFSQLSVSDRFASLLSDNIKFQKIEQIKEIKSDMMNFYPVRKLALSVRAQLGTELLAEAIAEKISNRTDGYYQLLSDDRIVMFTADECTARDKRTIELIGQIQLVELDKIHQRQICRWDSNRGIIKLEDDQIDSRLVMILYSPTWDRGGGVTGIAQRHVIRNVFLPGNITSRLGEENLLQTIDSIPSMLAKPTPYLMDKQKKVQTKIKRTINEISAEIHSRLVFGLGCITLILISIALGVMFRGGHLLSAFGASSIPAAALIVFIMLGKNLTKNPSIPPITGVIVMWSGLIFLSALVLPIYRRLTRT